MVTIPGHPWPEIDQGVFTLVDLIILRGTSGAVPRRGGLSGLWTLFLATRGPHCLFVGFQSVIMSNMRHLRIYVTHCQLSLLSVSHALTFSLSLKKGSSIASCFDFLTNALLNALWIYFVDQLDFLEILTFYFWMDSCEPLYVFLINLVDYGDLFFGTTVNSFELTWHGISLDLSWLDMPDDVTSDSKEKLDSRTDLKTQLPTHRRAHRHTLII